MTPWLDLPETERQRLHKNEVANRSRARKDNLPAVPVSVEGLWLIQRGCCACDKCRCEVPLVAGNIIIAHRKHLKAKTGSPGHMPHNVQLWSSECNAEEAKQEVSDSAKYDRFEPACMTISEKREIKEQRNGSKLQSANRWPKGRKINSRGFS